ncbi:hypothetical protein Hanom_Chr01g00088851 [Helianthus anomalus]
MARYDVAGEPMIFSQLGWPIRPTPGLKPMPQGPRRNPCPPGVVAWAFSRYPRPNSRPIPRGLTYMQKSATLSEF